MESEDVVLLDKVKKVYEGGGLPVTALEEISFGVKPRDFLAIAGPSGSGKTTCLNLIGALDMPSSGEVYVAGQNLGKLNGKQLSEVRRFEIGFIFQSFNLIPVLTAQENAEFTLGLQKVPKAERRRMSMEALEAVGLADFAHRRPHQLSGGQQQRVAIARAIAPQPKIILADEPTANLDSKTAESLLDLMEDLNSKGSAFVFSTHDQRIMDRAHRLLYLQDGHLISEKSKS